jgi:hypothetical protein
MGGYGTSQHGGGMQVMIKTNSGHLVLFDVAITNAENFLLAGMTKSGVP